MSSSAFPFFKRNASPHSLPKGARLGRKETIKGELERIVFLNEENHYTIARFLMDGQAITIVGNLFSANVGETLQLTGEWTQHKKFGYQFKVETFLALLPSTIMGIEKYLGSGLMKGIGPVMAKRLVARFGEATLDVMDQDVKALRKVEGIGEKRAEMISRAWREQREIRDVMIFLQAQQVSPAYAMKIFKRYGRRSIEVVRENPYRLAMEVTGIGFKMADRLANHLGIAWDSPHRVDAGVFYCLRNQSDRGHIFYPREKLIEEGKEILEVEEDRIREALDRLRAERLIVVEELGQGEERVKGVYTQPAYVAECEVASLLIKLRDFHEKVPLPRDEFHPLLQNLEKRLGIWYSSAQKKALERIWAGEKVLVITGGPGTGKTTLIRSLVDIFHGQGRKTLLAAPTGRAAKRMGEATGRGAKTIHRLLEYSFKKGGFSRDREMPLEADVVIIDEVSMIDNFLMFHLIRAIPMGATLILIGDVDQLPSVGPGNVLQEIINSSSVSVVYLNEIFRQKETGLIVRNAHRINRGEFPLLPEKGPEAKPEDFYFFRSEAPEDSIHWIIDLCKNRIVSRFPHIDKEGIQVISPMNRGALGAANLNLELQAALNPEGREICRAGRVFRIGDRVMQIRNNYDKGVFNGDMGRIVGIDLEEQELGVRIDNARVSYGFDELDQLLLAYAITVHKSQGSEYDAVILPMVMEHYLLMQRNLFYTAVTRARKLVVIVGVKQAIGIAVKNDRIRKRYTWLAERLGRHAGPTRP